ncbi:atherin-like [Mirounga angustirostris]|uniref:atherin-like n=1 Tax=Mirounga angustirostris TaxID=9716 RepID=UPI00313EE3DD
MRACSQKRERDCRTLGGRTWNGIKVRRASLSPAAARRRLIQDTQPGSKVSAQRMLAPFPVPPLLPHPGRRSPRRTPPRGPAAQRTRARPSAQPAAASARGRRMGHPHPGPQPDRRVADDPSPEPQLPRPERAPPPHTHRGAPSRVSDADARPTLTAAAASAEGWSSPPPSPTARGRRAKPPPPPPPPQQLRPPPRRPARSAPQASHRPPGRGPPPEAQPIGPRARGGRGSGALQQVGAAAGSSTRSAGCPRCPSGQAVPNIAGRVSHRVRLAARQAERTLGTRHLLYRPADSPQQ